ncbi:MAG TPA: hypothetical protein VMS22_20835 [Candidatus Eisenbacteria bacterium]|nr:hypothetical protein [Candidatus Eisenbacteria bacterium]
MKTRDISAEEKVQELFQPDTLLPSQYFDRIRRRASFDGERRLMVAILEDAVDVYRKQVGARDRKRHQLFEDAEAWIESADKSWIFSFENICDVLGIEAAYVRKGLRAWKARAGGERGQVVAFRTDDREDDVDRDEAAELA